MALGQLRDARWLNERRVRDYATMLIVTYTLAALWALSGSGIIDPLGRPVGTDFLGFWTVSAALHHGQADAIYAPLSLAALERAAAPGSDGFYAWTYPPNALLIVYPLAFLPYLWSLAAWLAAGLAGYLSALWRILPQPLTLWAGLAFPAVFVDLSHGQNGLLTAGLLGWALLLLERRSGVAGILLGVLAFKPQLGLLIPLALAAGGRWRAMLTAAATALGLTAMALALFGRELWPEFLASLPFARAMLEQELLPYYKMQSVFAALRMLGSPLMVAYALQGGVMVTAAALTVATWRRAVDQDLKNAVLATAGLLAPPYVLDYDLTQLALPVAWLLRRALRSGALPWEKLAIAAASVAPLVSRLIARETHLALAPLAEAALLAVLMARIRFASEPPGAAPCAAP